MTKKSAQQTVYAFIDSQNLNLGVKSQGITKFVKTKKDWHSRSVETLG